MATTRTDDHRLVQAWVDPDLADRLDEAAEEADRSRSAELRVVLRRHLQRGAEKEEQRAT